MLLTQLELPEHPQRLRETEEGNEIWDPIRKSFLKLTPEEWVRQNLRAHLVLDKQYPEQLITMEQGMNLNGMIRRTDMRVYKNSQCVMLIECKAPEVAIDQKVFDQSCRYNTVVKAPWILLSNGMQHIVSWMGESMPKFAQEIPLYSEL